MRYYIKSPKAFLVLATVSALFVSAGHGAEASYRKIPIPKKEHGYGNIHSRILKSEVEFQQFLSESEKHAWNQRKKFVDALNAAKTDFASESLVLLFFSEGSGSVRIGEPVAKVDGTALVVNVSREFPSGYGTGDMAYYGFAFAVKRKSITEVSLRVGQTQPVSMKIQE